MPRRFYPACCGVGSVLFLWGGAGWACGLRLFLLFGLRLFLLFGHPRDGWREQDSNLRRRGRQIYSLIPLTAWVSLRKEASRKLSHKNPSCVKSFPQFLNFFFHPPPQKNKNPSQPPTKRGIRGGITENRESAKKTKKARRPMPIHPDLCRPMPVVLVPVVGCAHRHTQRNAAGWNYNRLAAWFRDRHR